MAKLYIRLIVLITVIGAFIYGLTTGTFGMAILFILCGGYVELVGIRDTADDKVFGKIHSLSRLNIFGEEPEKK